MPSQDDDKIYKGLDVVICLYHTGGCTVKKVHADREFESLLSKINDKLDIEVKIENPDEHVGDIEILNRIIQEDFRKKFYCLPFKVIPKMMVNSLACVTTREMNLFPVNVGVSNYFSPHVILGKKQLHYRRDF